jgi:hypothetical protein
MELDGEPWMIAAPSTSPNGRQPSGTGYRRTAIPRSLFNSMQEGVALHKLIRSGGVPDNYILLDVNRRFEELG